MDSHAFHNALNPDWMTGVHRHTDFYQDNPYYGNSWTPRDYRSGDSGDRADGTLYNAHPSFRDTGDVMFGPGMSLFEGTDLWTDHLAMAICGWREGGHDIGSRVVCSGRRARDAVGYSSLIAKALGSERPRPLNYVQIANSGDLYTSVGLLGGDGEPIYINGSDMLTDLSEPAEGDIAPPRREAFNQLIADLASTRAITELPESISRDVFEGFSNSYLGGELVATSNWMAENSELLELIAFYEMIIETEIITQQLFLDRHQSSMTAPDLAWMDTLKLRELAFKFALAEFLVVNNLSSVVEFSGAFFDAHGGNQREAVMNLGTFAGLKHLMLRLRGVEIGGGDSLLSKTTLVMFTEWDRAPVLSGGTVRPGTDHGYTSSVIFGGAGIRGGAVVGRTKHSEDPTTPYPTHLRGFEDVPLVHPLPADLTTGEARPKASGGEDVLLESVFPTMCALYGVPVPPSQTTLEPVFEHLLV